jgi:hypothetical protein
VGSKELYFVKEYARFENLTQASSGPYDKAKNDPDFEESSDNGAPPAGHDPGGDEDEAPF